MVNLALILAYVGLGIMLAGSGMGSAVGVVMAGNCTIAGLKKNPDMFGKAMILSCSSCNTRPLWFCRVLLNVQQN